MSVVRQTVVRQLHSLLAIYGGVRTDPKGPAGEGGAQWGGSVLVSEEHEKLELLSIHMLQQARTSPHICTSLPISAQSSPDVHRAPPAHISLDLPLHISP